jgi:hypothetical protein
MMAGPKLIAVSHVYRSRPVTWALGREEPAGGMFLDLASITRIGGGDGAPSLVGYGDVAHLR